MRLARYSGKRENVQSSQLEEPEFIETKAKVKQSDVNIELENHHLISHNKKPLISWFGSMLLKSNNLWVSIYYNVIY